MFKKNLERLKICNCDIHLEHSKWIEFVLHKKPYWEHEQNEKIQQACTRAKCAHSKHKAVILGENNVRGQRI